MATQYDFNAGFDITGLASVTQAQLMQMVNQIAPLANIGGIIFQSSTPDVANNPRFERYIWIDTTSPTSPAAKLYNGTTWDSLSLPNDSVTAAKIADAAVTLKDSLGNLDRIAHKYDGSVDLTKAGYILRLDSNGQYVEIVALQTLLSGGVTFDITKLTPIGTANQVLVIDSTTNLPAWNSINSLITIASYSLALGVLADGGAGQAGYILRYSPTPDGGGKYAVIATSPDDKTSNLFSDNSIPVARLYAASAADRDKIRFNGTNWVKATPVYLAPTSGGTTIPDPTTGALLSVAHGLGAVPRTLKCLLVCTTGDIGYTAGDIVDGQALMTVGSGGEARVAVAVHANATTIFAAFGSQGAAVRTYKMTNKSTFAVDTVTPGSWDVFLYAEL